MKRLLTLGAASALSLLAASISTAQEPLNRAIVIRMLAAQGFVGGQNVNINGTNYRLDFVTVSQAESVFTVKFAATPQ